MSQQNERLINRRPNEFRGTEYPAYFFFYAWAFTGTLHEGDQIGEDHSPLGGKLFWELDASGEGMVFVGTHRHTRYDDSGEPIPDQWETERKEKHHGKRHRE